MSSITNNPETYYIFVSRYDRMAVHNLKFTKTFISAAYTYCTMDKDFLRKYLDGTATYLPYLRANPDLMVPSPYQMTAINDYRVEYDAEYYRLLRFPTYPSRLSAIFAFGDFETCEEVSRKYGWDLSTVRQFKLIRDDLTRITKVNMEVVSLARTAYRHSASDIETIEYIWNHYWSGAGNLQLEIPNIQDFGRQVLASGEIWEYLIEGSLVLVE